MRGRSRARASPCMRRVMVSTARNPHNSINLWMKANSRARASPCIWHVMPNTARNPHNSIDLWMKGNSRARASPCTWRVMPNPARNPHTTINQRLNEGQLVCIMFSKPGYLTYSMRKNSAAKTAVPMKRAQTSGG